MANPTLSDIDQKLNDVLASLIQIQQQLAIIKSEQVELKIQAEEPRQMVSNTEVAVINLRTPGV